MTPIDYVRIDHDILQDFDLSGTDKILLGLIESFNHNGLCMSNSALAEILGTTAKNVSKRIAILEAKSYIIIQARQSKWRKIYFRQKGEVESAVLPPKSGSSEALLTPFRGSTSPKRGNIIKETNKENIYIAFVDFWNTQEALPKIRDFSEGRKAKLKVRFKEETFSQNWQEIIQKLAASPFHTGQSKSGWKANVDWILANDHNYLKILERNTDSGHTPASSLTTEATPEEAARWAEDMRKAGY